MVFAYTTVANVIERPDGVKIGACFIAAIMVISLVSRLIRAFELRVTEVELDKHGRSSSCATAPVAPIRLVANEPDVRRRRRVRRQAASDPHDHELRRGRRRHLRRGDRRPTRRTSRAGWRCTAR